MPAVGRAPVRIWSSVSRWIPLSANVGARLMFVGRGLFRRPLPVCSADHGSRPRAEGLFRVDMGGVDTSFRCQRHTSLHDVERVWDSVPKTQVSRATGAMGERWCLHRAQMLFADVATWAY